MPVVTGSASKLNIITGISQIMEITAEEFTTLANKVLPTNIFVKLPNGQISLTDGVKTIAQLTPLWDQSSNQNSGSQIVVDKGQREVWRVTTASASGASITLPNSMSYVVGDNRLFLSVNGAVLLPTYNYTEVGNSGETSTSVSILMPLSVGDEVMAWTVPVCVGVSTLDSLVSRISALENTIADLSSENF
jgi:hypothetical protein